MTHYNSMIDEMDFVQQWLETGRDPNNYRGADKRGVYQYQLFQSMYFIPDITEQVEEGPKHLYISPEEKIIMANIFAALSFRERQCFIMHEGAKLSMMKIATELGVSKSMVQQSIRRAKNKIKMHVKGSLNKIAFQLFDICMIYEVTIYEGEKKEGMRSRE